LEDQKGRRKGNKNHRLYELVREKGITVKRGDEGETNRGGTEVDRHCLKQDGDVAGNLRPLLGRILAG